VVFHLFGRLENELRCNGFCDLAILGADRTVGRTGHNELQFLNLKALQNTIDNWLQLTASGQPG
jgi:hypothetical protein